ncbi:MAG TPA: hypothetical protein VGN83_10820 [Falsiroseomonas sp.]|jgi:hypothetical protein|nr:hypothetical protein [Falsiroseomonas sp.]
MARLPLALLLLILLAGCAERWARPGTSEAEAEAANAACQDRAAVAVPPNLAWTMVEPGGFDRDRHCRHVNGREVCRTYSRYRPPRYHWVDVNEGPREGWRRQCMVEQGFTFEGYRPLRLQ